MPDAQIITIPQPPPQPDKRVVRLDLTEDEASALMALVGDIGGSRYSHDDKEYEEHGPYGGTLREYTDDIWSRLCDLDIKEMDLTESHKHLFWGNRGR